MTLITGLICEALLNINLRGKNFCDAAFMHTKITWDFFKGEERPKFVPHFNCTAALHALLSQSFCLFCLHPNWNPKLAMSLTGDLCHLSAITVPHHSNNTFNLSSGWFWGSLCLKIGIENNKRVVYLFTDAPSWIWRGAASHFRVLSACA